MRHILTLTLFLLMVVSAQSQITIWLNPQQQFKETIPAGNYSGIAWLGGTKYAVVSDKSEHDGYFVFDMSAGRVPDMSKRNFRKPHACRPGLPAGPARLGIALLYHSHIPQKLILTHTAEFSEHVVGEKIRI